MSFRKTVPLQKWEKQDDGGLRFEACFSSDVVDKQGEIVPQPVTKAAVERWAAKNLREMHKDEAVGKAIDFDFRPDGASWLRGFVTAGAPLTVKKVEDGVLQMLSVGGNVKKQHKETRDGKVVTVIDDFDLSEISLVDNGANPDAWISVAKAAGLEKAVPPPKDGEKPKEGEDEPPAKQEGEGTEEPPPAEEEGKGGLSDKDKGEIVAKVTDAVLEALAKNGVMPMAQAPAAKTAPAPTAKKSEEPETRTFTVTLKGAGLLDVTNVKTIKAMRKALAAVERTPEIRKTDGMAAYDVRLALDCLSMLESLKSTEDYEVSEGQPESAAQLALLEAAIKALREFTASEAAELLEEADAEKAARGEMKKFMGEQETRVSGLVEQTGTLLKAVEDLKAGIGEVSAIREALAKLDTTKIDEKLGVLGKVEKGIDQILSMPIPGNTPLRLVTQGTLSKSASPHAERIEALKSAAVSAAPAVREHLLREVAAIERTYANE